MHKRKINFNNFRMILEKCNEIRFSPRCKRGLVGGKKHGRGVNNQIGMQIGKDNPDASMKDLASKTADYFHDNGLYTATVNKDGTVTIGQTKITDDQYKQMQGVIKTLDNNGFTPQEQKDNEARGKAELQQQNDVHTMPPVM